MRAVRYSKISPQYNINVAVTVRIECNTQMPLRRFSKEKKFICKLDLKFDDPNLLGQMTWRRFLNSIEMIFHLFITNTFGICLLENDFHLSD